MQEYITKILDTVCSVRVEDLIDWLVPRVINNAIEDLHMRDHSSPSSYS